MAESGAPIYPRGMKERPPDWPNPENHVVQQYVTDEQYRLFHRLISGRAREQKIERFLSENREVLSWVSALFDTGHHMSWLYPKEQIRPASGTVGGLIPDYLVAGANSNGVQWFMLELKGANARAFVKKRKRVYLSAEANQGICQLLNYIDLSSRDQAYLRDGLQLTNFREPRGVLLIGTDAETEDPQVRDFKRAWNKYNPTIQIRSYNSVLRDLKYEMESRARSRELWARQITA
jgi:hypothetical protein